MKNSPEDLAFFLIEGMRQNDEMTSHGFIAAIGFTASLFSLSSYAREEVPLYRTPASKYSSGTEFRDRLVKSAGQVISKTWIHITWQDAEATKSGWIRRSLLQMPQDFAIEGSLAPKSPLRKTPNWNLEPVSQTGESEETWSIESTQEDWIQIKKGSKTYWVPEISFTPKPSLFTYGLARSKSRLFKSPNVKSRVLKALNSTDKLRVFNTAISDDYDESWVRAEFEGVEGFINVDSLVTLLDLAQKVKTQSGQTIDVLFNLSGWIKSFRGQKISFAQISSVISDSKGVVSSEGANVRTEPELSPRYHFP